MPEQAPDPDPVHGRHSPAYFAWAGRHMPAAEFLALYGPRARKAFSQFEPDIAAAGTRAAGQVAKRQPRWDREENPKHWAMARAEREHARQEAEFHAATITSNCAEAVERLRMLIALQNRKTNPATT